MDSTIQVDLGRIAQDLQIRRMQVESVVQLLDEGNTVPFITRYRKERTGNLEETAIREIQQRVGRLRELAERKQTVLRSIEAQGRLTEDLAEAIRRADLPQRLEDLYLPFKPKKRTKASDARDKGLEPLALRVWNRDETLTDLRGAAEAFVDPSKGVDSAEQAIEGAGHILAESISELANVRDAVRRVVWRLGRVVTRKADNIPEGQGVKYADYFDYAEPLGHVPPHRVLAINRGDKEGPLKVRIEVPPEELERTIRAQLPLEGHPQGDLFTNAAFDAMDRLLLPSIEREVRRELTERAEYHAVEVFARNLRSLLLQPPIAKQTVLAVDPGFRTGCKVAVLDPLGSVKEHGVVFLMPPHRRAEGKRYLKDLVGRHEIQVVAIGNGTASREAEELIVEIIEEGTRFHEMALRGEVYIPPPPDVQDLPPLQAPETFGSGLTAEQQAAADAQAQADATPTPDAPAPSVIDEPEAPAPSVIDEPEAPAAPIGEEPPPSEEPTAPGPDPELPHPAAEEAVANDSAEAPAPHGDGLVAESVVEVEPSNGDAGGRSDDVEDKDQRPASGDRAEALPPVSGGAPSEEVPPPIRGGAPDDEPPPEGPKPDLPAEPDPSTPSTEPDAEPERSTEVPGQTGTDVTPPADPSDDADAAATPAGESALDRTSPESGPVPTMDAVAPDAAPDADSGSAPDGDTPESSGAPEADPAGVPLEAIEAEVARAEAGGGEIEAAPLPPEAPDPGATPGPDAPTGAPGPVVVDLTKPPVGMQGKPKGGDRPKDKEKASGKKQRDRDQRPKPKGPPPPPAPHTADPILSKLAYVIVNEAGASVYSASPIGKDEFPNYDATTRGTISIGRRLQDPLAELVKIDPQNIGVGLYQHDVGARPLKESLESVIESCVNHVGVDLNTASAALLRHVSGLNSLTARRLVEYRQERGPFARRDQIKGVEGIGDASFTQAAGFLKVLEGESPLDRTWVHPESYPAAEALLSKLGADLSALADREGLAALREKLAAVADEQVSALAEELGIGELTLRDILEALARPGRDPREDLPKPVFKKGFLKLEDLQAGMELRGTVLNVVDFGAFVDIGLKDSGLVHISQLANRYVKSPHDVVSVGDVVTAWVLSVDQDRKKVSLTMVAPGTERPRGGRPSEGEGDLEGRSRGPRNRGRARGRGPGGQAEGGPAAGLGPSGGRRPGTPTRHRTHPRPPDARPAATRSRRARRRSRWGLAALAAAVAGSAVAALAAVVAADPGGPRRTPTGCVECPAPSTRRSSQAIRPARAALAGRDQGVRPPPLLRPARPALEDPGRRRARRQRPWSPSRALESRRTAVLDASPQADRRR